MDKAFLTVKDLSVRLNVSEKTVYRMITAEAIPFAIKIGGQWRFNAEKIEKWAQDSLSGGKLNKQINLKISVADALTNGLIIYRAHGESRDEVLDEILGMVADLSTDESTSIKKQILYHESIISSSLQGMSFMAPEIDGPYQINQTKLLVAFLDKPMDFNAVDKAATEVVFLLLANNKTEQLIIKTRMTRLFMDRKFLVTVKEQLNRRELIEQVTAIEGKILG